MKKFFLFLMFIHLGSASQALDLIETYSDGPSDLEIYHNSGKAQSGQSLTFGYGYSAILNPSVSVSRFIESSENTNTLGFSNITHVLDKEGFGIHFVVGVEQADSENTTFAEMELKKDFVSLRPYGRLSLEKEGDMAEAKGHALGLSLPIHDHLECLAEIQGDQERTTDYAFGVNYVVKDGFELISEIAQSEENNETNTTVGLIITL